MYICIYIYISYTYTVKYAYTYYTNVCINLELSCLNPPLSSNEFHLCEIPISDGGKKAGLWEHMMPLIFFLIEHNMCPIKIKRKLALFWGTSPLLQYVLIIIVFLLTNYSTKVITPMIMTMSHDYDDVDYHHDCSNHPQNAYYIFYDYFSIKFLMIYLFHLFVGRWLCYFLSLLISTIYYIHILAIYYHH